MSYRAILGEVLELEANLRAKYNKHITLHVKVHKYSLDEIEKTVNSVFQEKNTGPYEPEGIRSKRRFGQLILFRQIYYYIAWDHRFSLSQIGTQIGFDHATVLYGLRTFKNLLSAKDFHAIKYLNLVTEQLNNKQNEKTTPTVA